MATKKTKDKYIIMDREAGNVIDGFKTLKAAQNALLKYERIDKKDGTYTPNFYKISEIGKVKRGIYWKK